MSQIIQEILATFDAGAGEHPENVAIGVDGTIYVTLHRAAKVWKGTPDGQTTFITVPKPFDPGAGTRINGVVADPQHGVYVAVRSEDVELAGIWQLLPTGLTRKVADLRPSAGLNGMAIDRAGRLYVADDTAGLLWRINLQQRAVDIWLDDPVLKPQGSSAYGGPLFGANGVKVFRGAVYVSNSSTASVFRIPIRADGNAGPVEHILPFVVFHNIDDFAFDEHGSLFFTTVVDQTVERVTPTGEVEVVLRQQDGLDMPTAVAFGAIGADRTSLYITNAAFYSAPGTIPHASLMRLDVGRAGEPR